MADQKLSQKSTLTKSTIATNDLVYVADVSASATKGITYQELIQPLDTQFAIADNSDTTKKIAFQASGITTGTTRTLTAPDADTTIVGTDTTQTLTNKTLTSPQINMSSNATGDMYYRNSGGTTVRLPIGSSGQILNADATGIPAWVANPAASDATTAIKGVVELGTQAENDAGTGTPTTTASLIPTIGTIRARLLNTGVVDTGTSTAYAIAPTPAITAYAAYQEFTFKAVNANTTTTPTLNVNSVGAVTIKNPDGTALAVGQISANSIQKVVYDGTNFQLVSYSTNKNAFLRIPSPEQTMQTDSVQRTQCGCDSSQVVPTYLWLATADSTTSIKIYRLELQSSGNYMYCGVTVNLATTTNNAILGICESGNKVYIRYTSNSARACTRYDIDLTNPTSITGFGTASVTNGMFASQDGSTIYTFDSSTTDLKSYTVSGTTASSTGTITLTVAIASNAIIGRSPSGTFYSVDRVSSTVQKWNSSGTNQTSITRQAFNYVSTFESGIGWVKLANSMAIMSNQKLDATNSWYLQMQTVDLA